MARPKRSSSWNADKVIMAIRDWRERDLPLNKVWKQNKPLHRAATRYFGGWHAALTAAEFETQSRRKWSKELVLEELRSYHLPSGRRVRHYDPRLVAVAIRYFGSLRNALSEAGLESYRKWNKRLIVEAIQDRYIRGLQVHSLWDTDRPLASAGKSHFGSWKAALTAAGLASEYREPKPTKKWSKQLVIEAIQAHHRDGLPMTKVWKEDANLYSMGKKYFGSWRNAMAAAGLPMQRRTWSKQIVIDEIQTRLQEGRSLCGRNRENKALTSSAIHYFGSWRKAVQVARRTKQAKPR